MTPTEIWEAEPRPVTDEELLARFRAAAEAGPIPSSVRRECFLRSSGAPGMATSMAEIQQPRIDDPPWE